MNILHIISSANPKGGGPIEGIKQLNMPLKKLGASRVDILSLDSPKEDYVVNFPLNNETTKLYALGPTLLNYGYTSKLRTWLLRNISSYDVVIINGLWQFSSFGFWLFWRKYRNIPYIIFTHGMLDPWFKYKYPIKHIKKWLYWPWAEFKVIRDATFTLFTCEEERRVSRKSFWLYKANEFVVNYGISEPPKSSTILADKFLNHYPHLRNKVNILYLSRINKKKGCDLLIEAFASCFQNNPEVNLVMAGPDHFGWIEFLKNAALQLGVEDRITWTGMLDGDLKWGAYYASDIFCLPSHQENFGIVVAEALSCGLPVLISNKVNIWREIENRNCGFIDDDTLEGTIRNFNKWINISPANFSIMKKNSITCFHENFHVNAAALSLMNVLKRALIKN